MLPVVPYKKQLSWYIDSRTESERRQAAYAAESAPSYVHLPQLGARPCVGDGCTETLQAAYVCVSIFPLPDGGSTGHPPGVSGHRGCARATYVGDERAGAPPLTLPPCAAPGASSRTARLGPAGAPAVESRGARWGVPRRALGRATSARE